MEIPTERQQRRDFRTWQSELRRSSQLNGETYEAPSRATRFMRAFSYWFASYEKRRGPIIESFPRLNEDGSLGTRHELIEPEDDERNLS